MSDPSKAIQILTSAKSAGRLHHAILLYGTSLVALENVAKSASEILLGKYPGRHPDLFELRPEGKARHIRVGAESDKVGGDWPPNTMRRMIRDLRQTSNMGGEKVAIIYEADRMNNVAANAFLKTLEEPPSGTTIFILSTRPNDLLDTIRSRCIAMRVDTPPERIDDEEWKLWLEDFKKWQQAIMRGGHTRSSAGNAAMRAYGLLSRFDAILSRLTEGSANLDEISKEEADYNHLYQTLIGDTADNYKGCPGIGSVGAHKILDESPTWEAVVAAFEKKGLDEEEALLQARVARILRAEDYDFKKKVPKMWTPVCSKTTVTHK